MVPLNQLHDEGTKWALKNQEQPIRYCLYKIYKHTTTMSYWPYTTTKSNYFSIVIDWAQPTYIHVMREYSTCTS